MAVTYKKLFHLLIDKGMTNAELMEKAGFSANIITRIKRDNYISLDSIETVSYTHLISSNSFLYSLQEDVSYSVGSMLPYQNSSRILIRHPPRRSFHEGRFPQLGCGCCS